MSLKSFKEVSDFINEILKQNGQDQDAKTSPHQLFWSNLTYDQFVNGAVPGVTDPDTGQPIPILVKGNSGQSNLILSLRGEGPLFEQRGAFGQMPADGPPFFSDEQIMQIADWIDANCPQ